MFELELSGEAFEEVREKCIAAGLIVDEPREWDEDSKPFTVSGITFREWQYVASPEFLARMEEFRKTPLGELMQHQLEITAARMFEVLAKPNVMIDRLTTGLTTETDIGTSLRIRMPNDYRAD